MGVWGGDLCLADQSALGRRKSARVGVAGLGDSIVALTGLIGRLQAERLRRLAVFDGQGGAAASGARGSAGWLRWRCRTGAGQAAAQVALARALDRTLPLTRAALAAGQIGFDHARVLAYGTADVPAELVAAAEPMLVEHAGTLEPHRLRLVVEHWRAHVVPEASDRDAEHAYQRRRLDVAGHLRRHRGGQRDPRRRRRRGRAHRDHRAGRQPLRPGRPHPDLGAARRRPGRVGPPRPRRRPTRTGR